MNVYAQPTDFNWRLCSLLSAVLNRSLRPDFVAAIQHKANVLLEETDSRLRRDRPHLGLVFIGPSTAIEALATRVPKFSREYELDIAMVPVCSSTQTPVASILKILQLLEKSIRFFIQTERRVVVVSISSGVDVAGQFLSTTTHAELEGILGMIVVDPPHNDFLPTHLQPLASLPVLVTLSWNEDQLVGRDRQLYLAHPNVILVQHNHSDIYGVDWEEQSSTWDDADLTSSSNVSLLQTYQLWLVRTIAKFSEAVAIIDPKSCHKVNENSIRMLKSGMAPRHDHLLAKL